MVMVMTTLAASKYIGEEVAGQLEDQDVDLSDLRIMMPVSRMSALTVPEPGYNMLSSR